MIELRTIKNASALWSIDGREVVTKHRTGTSKDEMIDKITEFKHILKTRLYETDHLQLPAMFNFFGGIAFVTVGLTSYEDFINCYSYFAMLFAEEWADGPACLKSKHIGVSYVFERMIRDESNPINYDFRYILDDIKDSHIFCEILEETFSRYWTPKVKENMQNLSSLKMICRRVGEVRLSKYMMRIKEDTEKYLKELAQNYTKNRELISMHRLHLFIFGEKSRQNFRGGEIRLFDMMKKITEDELAMQNLKFIAENHKAMSISTDLWVLYTRLGVTLQCLRIDFTQINRVSMRHEAKCFLKDRFSGAFRVKDRIFSSIYYSANLLCENNTTIRYFSDIDETDVKMLQLSMESKNKKQSYIMSVFSSCKVLMNYLCEEPRDEVLKTPRSYKNPFDNFTFVNASRFSKNTAYIPDWVLDQIKEHLNELSDTDRLVYKIFCETGMRAKEVVYLEENCLNKARYDDRIKLRYIPYKTLKARRKAGISDYHSVYISSELALQIRHQIQKSDELRQKCSLPYIFLHQNEGYKISMFNTSYFIIKVNALLRKYNICDNGGELWNFTSRQCRKTIVVNMIEKGATVEEIVYQLGHLDMTTASKFYAEVKAIKLAELNSDFFKKQFDILLSNEQLCKYTEEERRFLYIDFRLGYRRIEMGFCVRKLSNGGCNNRNHMYHCVNCTNLCTGRQYLSHWKELLLSQENTVNELLSTYKKEKIEDYSEFIELRQENSLLSAYRNIVCRIEESEVKCR